jgi:transposase
VVLGLVGACNTSRTCNKCGHCEKANRKSQAEFRCCLCDYSANADFSAACNIARAPVIVPIVAWDGCSLVHDVPAVTSPRL